MSKEIDFIPYYPTVFNEEESALRAKEYYDFMDKRRSIREFSDKPVSKKVLEHIIMTASSAPSGAHKQPWSFCLVSDPDLKSQIRKKAEEEEYISYHGRMGKKWLEDIKPLGTDYNKPFLEIAPWLIVVFKRTYESRQGERLKNYYVNESVGIACGMLLSAIHNAGLVALTHTPSPMNFLSEILKRSENEKPFLLIPVGYPKEGVLVPDLKRKEFDEVADVFE